MLGGWQLQLPHPLGEMVSRVWGGQARRCVLKGATNELAVDVVEVRIVPEHFEAGCLLPAHGTFTVDVRSDQAWAGLKHLARTREVVVLERPDGGSLELRLGVLATSGSTKLVDGSRVRPTMTFSWDAP